MKKLNVLVLILASLFLTSCFEDNDDIGVTGSQINDFVWKGMNLFYLYKDDVPDLANDRFSGDNEYASYLNGFNSPTDLFESLVYQPQSVDRFSRIFTDFIALEQLLDGVFITNGMEYQIFRFSLTDTNRYGIVTHVLPNSSAETQGIKRGDIFYGIDGTQLTGTNGSQLLGQNNYNINLGIYNDNETPNDNTDDFIDETATSISLSKSQYSENPIFINTVLNIDNKKIGYLMYNAFTNDYNAQLNSVFGDFTNSNIDELILDLRYNSGGSVNSAILLAALITGQFTGEILSTEEWNSEFQAVFEQRDPELLINRFPSSLNDSPINSLGLTKVYILTTARSASASELVINSLRPYINVVQIGTNTTGKYQASRIVYDSPNFGRQGANPAHTYAMLPLIYKSVNSDGVTDYFDGLDPDITLREDLNNYGILGNENEPLLAAAISDINGIIPRSINQKTNSIKITSHSKDYIPPQLGMYSDKEIPEDLLEIK
ncbi:MAG: S41 family peptidase [Algibacter sp.]|uniref:S41 family peptidase n=1 Tax=Algibacter sp. TaxID=1872428 RepID=UPI00263493E5|nr:S41 family peptidase [Algibacter sp.]MDG1728635.1 S41 family peptidase [Algibacter sp.]MDG2179620.1 S41 family peptidase [Algibacter sp.]